MILSHCSEDCSYFDFAAHAATLSTSGFCQPVHPLPVRPERSEAKSKGDAMAQTFGETV
jgi:hypothetical protein